MLLLTKLLRCSQSGRWWSFKYAFQYTQCVCLGDRTLYSQKENLQVGKYNEEELTSEFNDFKPLEKTHLTPMQINVTDF